MLRELRRAFSRSLALLIPVYRMRGDANMILQDRTEQRPSCPARLDEWGPSVKHTPAQGWKPPVAPSSPKVRRQCGAIGAAVMFALTWLVGGIFRNRNAFCWPRR